MNNQKTINLLHESADKLHESSYIIISLLSKEDFSALEKYLSSNMYDNLSNYKTLLDNTRQLLFSRGEDSNFDQTDIPF